MKARLLSRGTGKTYLAIRKSADEQIPIVCCDQRAIQSLLELARRRGLTIPKPISIHDLNHLEGDNTKVIVDSLDYCLTRLFPHIDIVWATINND